MAEAPAALPSRIGGVDVPPPAGLAAIPKSVRGERQMIIARPRPGETLIRASARAASVKRMPVEGGSLPESPSVVSSAPRLRVGDHVLSPRRFITHHGIYAGNGQVIHYAGLASGLQAGPVKVSSLEDFLEGHPYKVREYKTRRYSREESVERAQARLGEDLYHAAFNNCEHFVAWCITGNQRSTQVDLLFALFAGPWGVLLSRSGPTLHALYRRIRANFHTPQNRLWVRRQRDERRVK